MLGLPAGAVRPLGAGPPAGWPQAVAGPPAGRYVPPGAGASGQGGAFRYELVPPAGAALRPRWANVRPSGGPLLSEGRLRRRPEARRAVTVLRRALPSAGRLRYDPTYVRPNGLWAYGKRDGYASQRRVGRP